MFFKITNIKIQKTNKSQIPEDNNQTILEFRCSILEFVCDL